MTSGTLRSKFQLREQQALLFYVTRLPMLDSQFAANATEPVAKLLLTRIASNQLSRGIVRNIGD